MIVLPEIPVESTYCSPKEWTKMSSVKQATVHSLHSNLMKNLLANISLAAEMFQETNSVIDAKMYLEIVSRYAARLHHIVDKFQQYDEASTKENISIYQAIDEVILQSQEQIEKKKIGIVRKYCPGILESPFKGEKIKIALENIIENAIEALPPSGGRLTIHSKLENGFPILEIADNGCGIEEERIANLFNSSCSTKYGGIGIGLVGAYEIFTANQIGISVQSKFGAGTRFILLFNTARF